MPIITLTPASISSLAQFILAFVIAVYFLYLRLPCKKGDEEKRVQIASGVL